MSERWQENETLMKRFWAGAGNLGFDRDAVHKKLGVESVNDFEGTLGQALSMLDDRVAAKAPASAQGQAEQGEAEPPVDVAGKLTDQEKEEIDALVGSFAETDVEAEAATGSVDGESPHWTDDEGTVDKLVAYLRGSGLDKRGVFALFEAAKAMDQLEALPPQHGEAYCGLYCDDVHTPDGTTINLWARQGADAETIARTAMEFAAGFDILKKAGWYGNSAAAQAEAKTKTEEPKAEQPKRAAAQRKRAAGSGGNGRAKREPVAEDTEEAITKILRIKRADTENGTECYRAYTPLFKKGVTVWIEEKEALEAFIDEDIDLGEGETFDLSSLGLNAVGLVKAGNKWPSKIIDWEWAEMA